MLSGNYLKKTAIAGVCVIASAFSLFSQTPQGQNQGQNQAQPKAAQTNPANTAEQPSDIDGWRTTDFTPYVKALNDLDKVTKEYSSTVQKQAQDEFSSGTDILNDMQNEIIKSKAAYEKKNNLNERWYWQEIDRKNEEARHIAYVKTDAKMKSVTHFTKAINLLDKVQSNEVRKSPEFIKFQIMLFQAYVSTQYDLYNLKPCIPILEQYININDKTRNDPWAYKYMASCYGFMETHLTKSTQSNEDKIIDYRQKKNRSMLRATELVYGIDSPQYQQLKDIVEVNEKKSENINAFK